MEEPKTPNKMVEDAEGAVFQVSIFHFNFLAMVQF